MVSLAGGAYAGFSCPPGLLLFTAGGQIVQFHFSRTEIDSRVVLGAIVPEIDQPPFLLSRPAIRRLRAAQRAAIEQSSNQGTAASRRLDRVGIG